MTSRNALRAVVDNFLGTYTSRYSDIDGYWLFGHVVTTASRQSIDLLVPCESPLDKDPTQFAKHLAVEKFRSQLSKSGVDPAFVVSAVLEVFRSREKRSGEFNGRTSQGYDVSFSLKVKSDTGKVFESCKVLFVAPHDPDNEFRSTRENPSSSPVGDTLGSRSILDTFFRWIRRS